MVSSIPPVATLMIVGTVLRIVGLGEKAYWLAEQP